MFFDHQIISQFWYGFCLRNVYFWNPDKLTKFMKKVASDSEVFFQRLKSYRSKTLAHGSVGIANEFIMLDNSEQVLVKQIQFSRCGGYDIDRFVPTAR